MVEMEMSILSQGAEGDESEYVFIQEDDMDFDEESYDHCDLSPDLSCAASVCSGVTLGDFKDVTASMVSLEDRNDGENREGKKVEDVAMANESAPARRLCNKKRRKKLKMMKKAAAAAHFEAVRKAQEGGVVATSGNSAERPVGRSKSRGKKSNLAVACAQETLAAYGEETRDKKVNYVL